MLYHHDLRRRLAEVKSVFWSTIIVYNIWIIFLGYFLESKMKGKGAVLIFSKSFPCFEVSLYPTHASRRVPLLLIGSDDWLPDRDANADHHYGFTQVEYADNDRIERGYLAGIFNYQLLSV